ncbi:hypothetical protein OWV82_023229 [Melia azedarach]|uniref:Uncharacterized protein n=1 Tax=Melia azedarach TaxID=155640 RepID=A0ACC1WX40_MELAZ|nr:hypothetical protein OWV82_023229 [Melia azedarach]
MFLHLLCSINLNNSWHSCLLQLQGRFQFKNLVTESLDSALQLLYCQKPITEFLPPPPLGIKILGFEFPVLIIDSPPPGLSNECFSRGRSYIFHLEEAAKLKGDILWETALIKLQPEPGAFVI